VKLLFDENLSYRLVELLSAEFPGSAHVGSSLGRRRGDVEIWERAIVAGYSIVSKDNDFRQRAFILGPPPKVIWLAVGNAGTEEILDLLRAKVEEVNRFGGSAGESLLVLGP
jgi:predicted nuclease of predicted toxin-antitoxin system